MDKNSIFWDRGIRRATCYMSFFIIFIYDLMIAAFLIVKKPEGQWIAWFYIFASLLFGGMLFGLLFFLEDLPDDYEKYKKR